ncbi:MAG: twin-arginine translocase subunit TatB [Acidimicrobiia bacterium]|nr:twin-arginine translocase subunit TatB [Acidimicrobiia bacterium]
MLQGGEILIILIVALLVLGPERLPILARKAGEWTQKMRSAATDLTQGLEKEVSELKDLAEEAGRPISEIRSELRKSVDEVGMSRLDWVGPKPQSGPGPEQAISDLDRIERGEDPETGDDDSAEKPGDHPPEAAQA